jgi:hypothetical protein
VKRPLVFYQSSNFPSLLEFEKNIVDAVDRAADAEHPSVIRFSGHPQPQLLLTTRGYTREQWVGDGEDCNERLAELTADFTKEKGA